MTPKKLRLLAECLDNNFITEEDRKSWANDLRGMAKSMERDREDAATERSAEGKDK